MSVEALLEFIRQRFSSAEGQTLARSLQKDPLVWEFANDQEKSLHYFESEPIELNSFSPGNIALWMITEKTKEPLGDLKTMEISLPDTIKKQAAQAFDTTFNTGMPPTDLLTAGLLAFSLHERRILKGNWKGIPEEIFINRNKNAIHKNYLIWRTAFACLFRYCSDFNDLIDEFIHSKSISITKTSIPIFIHVFLANPVESPALFDLLFSFAKNLPIDMQLDCLKYLETFHRSSLRKRLSENLMQTKNNMDIFTSIFSELEAFTTDNIVADPLDKQVRYSLPEDINRLAAFYYHIGDDQKAVETYQKSVNLLDFIKTQTLFQSLTSNADHVSHGQWLEIIKSIPNSKQARFFYIRALIDENKYEEASKYVQELPPSPQKSFLEMRIDKLDNKTNISPILYPPDESQPDVDFSSEPSHFVHKAKLNTLKETLQTLLNLEEPTIDHAWLEQTLKENLDDLQVVILGRDILAKVGQVDKAIELSSYLERVDPEEIEHKRSLAYLYSLSKRWEKAFSILQGLVQSETSPLLKDLESFAEAALRTDHINMAISISQNILQKNKNNTKALVLLGEAYMLKGDIAKSIQHMEEVVAMIPEDAETWLTLAHLWQSNGQTDRSFEILNKGILAIPNNPELLRALGIAYLEKLAPSDALTCLKKAFEIEPMNIEGRLNLARAEHLLGHYQEAWQLLEPFLNNYEGNPEVAKLLGHVLLAMNNKTAAEPVLISASEQFPEDLETVLAATRLVLDRFESSIDDEPGGLLNRIKNILQETLQHNQDDFQIRLHLADIDRLKGNHQKALDVYKNFSDEVFHQKSTGNWRIQYGLGQSEIALGNNEIGLAALKEAASKQPQNLIVLHALAEAYQAADLHGKAQDLAKSSLKLAPQDLNNIQWYANFNTINNEPEEAVKALKEALRIDPDSIALKLWLSKTLLVIGSIEEAKQTIKEVINSSSPTPKQLHQAAYTCIHLHKLDLAVEALEKACQLDLETDPIRIMDLAVSYTLLGQRKKALETLNLDNNLLTEYPQLVLLKSDLLCDLGQYGVALKKLEDIENAAENALNVTNKNHECKQPSPLLYTYDLTFTGYLYRLGLLNRGLEEIDKAQTYFSTALALDPTNEKLRYATHESYMVGLNFDKAVEIAAGNLQLDSSSNGIGQDYLDWVCSQVEVLLYMGEIEQAATLFNKLPQSINTYPRYLAIQSRLAADRGEIEIAKEHLFEAVNTFQENLEDQQSNDMRLAFRIIMNLNSLAEAAITLDDYQMAIQLHEKASIKFDCQPLLNWRYVLSLIKAAEAQQISEALMITTHCPGKEILSEKYHKLAQELINKLEGSLSPEQIMCLKARMVSAFTGKWPMNLNSDACLIGPEEAASVVIGSDDEELVQDILESYPDDLKVLQAFGIYALQHSKNDGLLYTEKALMIDTSNPINHALLAFLRKDEPEQAIKSLETALDFWPDEPEWHAIAADLHFQIGNDEAAAHHIELALEIYPENAKLWQKSAEINIRNNDLVHAKVDLEKSASIQSKDPKVWSRMADVNRWMGNASEAIQNIRVASELDPGDIDIATQEVKFLIDQKRFADAEMKAEEITQKKNPNDTVVVLLASVQARQGKFDQALDTITKAIKKDPQNTKLILERLKIKKDLEGTESVLPELISLAQDHSEDPGILTTLTDWLIQTNRLKKAEEIAQTILKVVPEQPEVHLMLGRLQRKNGQLDQAIAHLSNAITFNPNMVDAYIELGKTYQERRDLEKALAVFQKGSQADASDPRPYYFAGMALKECKDYSGAEAMLKQAKKYSPDDVNIVRQLGVITALNLINNLRETR